MLKILCTAEFDKNYLDILSEFAEVKQRGFSVHQDFREMLTKEELINELQNTDIFIVGYDNVTNEILKSAPDLKLILSVRDGPEENIDVKTCKELGIPILFSSGRCIRSVSEQTMMLILASARPLLYANKVLYNGDWSKETLTHDPNRYYNTMKRFDKSREIYGKTLGIIGVGRNGMGLAQRAQAFGMNIIAYDPFADENLLKAQGIQLTDLMTLMSTSDYISMMARITPESIKMIGEKEFSVMKQDACFINTARAALVDTNALLKALQNGKIRAAFEVWDEEPITQDNPFLKLDPDRVLLLPHFAGCSIERITFHSKAATQNILDFLNGIDNNHFFDKDIFNVPAFAKHGGLLWNSSKLEITSFL